MSAHFSRKFTRSQGPSNLAQILRENREMILAQEKLARRTKEGLISLKRTANLQTDELNEHLLNVYMVLETIEMNRLAMVEDLKNSFLKPVEILLKSKSRMNTLSSDRLKGEWDKKKAETLKNVFQILLQSQQRF
ncbi:MAG: hypothetical protein ACTSX0_14300, partial [Promethearchaeota archaeon]